MKTTVEWPTGLTRERLMELADITGHVRIDKALRALAECAPSGKPETEPLWVWIDDRGADSSALNDPHPEGALRVEVPVLPKKPRTVTMHFYRDEDGNVIATQSGALMRYRKIPPVKLFTREIPLEA